MLVLNWDGIGFTSACLYTKCRNMSKSTKPLVGTHTVELTVGSQHELDWFCILCQHLIGHLCGWIRNEDNLYIRTLACHVQGNYLLVYNRTIIEW